MLANLKEYPVGIDLQKALAHPGSADDLVLRDGDVLYIPQQQSTVKVSGSVTYPNSVTYTKGMDVRDCLSQAGGYNDIARKYPIVIYMNSFPPLFKRKMIFASNVTVFHQPHDIAPPTQTQTYAEQAWQKS